MLISVLLTAVSSSDREITAAQYEPSQAPKPRAANSWHKRFVKYTPSARKSVCLTSLGQTYKTSKQMRLQTRGRSGLMLSLGLVFTWLRNPRQAREGNKPFLPRRGRAKALTLLKGAFSEAPRGCCNRGDNRKPSLHGGGPWKAGQACWSSNAGRRGPMRPQTRAFWLGKLNYTFGRWNDTPAFKQRHLLFARRSQAVGLARRRCDKAAGGVPGRGSFPCPKETPSPPSLLTVERAPEKHGQ